MMEPTNVTDPELAVAKLADKDLRIITKGNDDDLRLESRSEGILPKMELILIWEAGDEIREKMNTNSSLQLVEDEESLDENFSGIMNTPKTQKLLWETPRENASSPKQNEAKEPESNCRFTRSMDGVPVPQKRQEPEPECSEGKMKEKSDGRPSNERIQELEEEYPEIPKAARNKKKGKKRKPRNDCLWTNEEHEKLETILLKIGDSKHKWKICELRMQRTRTADQCKSHMQKFKKENSMLYKEDKGVLCTQGDEYEHIKLVNIWSELMLSDDKLFNVFNNNTKKKKSIINFEQFNGVIRYIRENIRDIIGLQTLAEQ